MKAIPALCATLAVLAALALPANAAPDSESMILNADANGDGMVTRAEFINHRSALLTMLDTDSSGSLTQTEFTTFVGDMGKRMANMAFSKADANGDGAISQSEWDANPPRAFDKADKNGDGVLDAREIASIRKRG